jgi:thiol-disulfide isomerase/thioredoxin
VNAASAPLLPTNALALPDFTFGRFERLLSQLHGTPVVVNVWGSWCGPCREEGPRLAAAARTYGRRVQFLGLDLRDTQDAGRGFIEQMHWTYPSVFDPTPRGDVETQLGYFAQPVTIFYDRAGRKAMAVSGPVSTPALQAGIGKILR